MKQIQTLFLSAVILLPMAATAQNYNMEINLRNGSVTSIEAGDVVNVTFSETSPLPGDAGHIKAEVNGIGGYLLSIGKIKNADTYRWTRDGKTIQEGTATSLHVSDAGKYSVVGINDNGEGKASPELQVNPIEDIHNILTEVYIPDKKLRNYIKKNFVPEGEILTNLQAASITGGFNLPKDIESLQGIEFFTGIDSIQTFVSNSIIKEIDLSKNVSLKKIAFNDYFNLEKLNIEGLNQLESFDISWTKLKKFDVSQLPEGLKYLGLGHLDYTDFDCQRFTQLEELIIYDNKLGGTLDLSGMKNLRRVQASSNAALEGIDVTGCISLRNLNVAYCSVLSALDVTSCPALEELYTQYSSIGNVDLSVQRENLKVFVPQGSLLTGIDLKGMKNLEVCQLGDLILKELPDFSDCVSLKNLRMEHSGLKEYIDVSHNKNMEDINIYEDNITGIALEDMPSLWNVNLFSNPNLTTLELKNLPSIQSLACYDLPKLERVDISTINPMASIYLHLCPKLKEIKVWEGFDINNPPASIAKDAGAKFVYEFSE